MTWTGGQQSGRPGEQTRTAEAVLRRRQQPVYGPYTLRCRRRRDRRSEVAAALALPLALPLNLWPTSRPSWQPHGAASLDGGPAACAVRRRLASELTLHSGGPRRRKCLLCPPPLCPPRLRHPWHLAGQDSDPSSPCHPWLLYTHTPLPRLTSLMDSTESSAFPSPPVARSRRRSECHRPTQQPDAVAAAVPARFQAAAQVAELGCWLACLPGAECFGSTFRPKPGRLECLRKLQDNIMLNNTLSQLSRG